MSIRGPSPLPMEPLLCWWSWLLTKAENALRRKPKKHYFSITSAASHLQFQVPVLIEFLPSLFCLTTIMWKYKPNKFIPPQVTLVLIFFITVIVTLSMRGICIGIAWYLGDRPEQLFLDGFWRTLEPWTRNDIEY